MELVTRLPADAGVAFLRLGRMGDILVATPALRALRAAAPRGHVTLLSDAIGEELAPRLPWVDEVVVVPAGAEDIATHEGDPDVRRFLADMRSRHFDVAFQCVGAGVTMNPLVRALGAGLAIGQCGPSAEPLDLWISFQRPSQPEAIRLLDILGLVGVERSGLQLEIGRLPDDEMELRQVREIDHTALAEGRTIGVHVGAGSGSRRWPPERFTKVIDALLDESDCDVVLIGGRGEEAITRAVLRATRRPDRVHDLAGRLTLGALIALLSQLRLLIGNDSGPAHLAQAVGTPAVIIFGSGHPVTWGPISRVWHRPVSDVGAPCRTLGQGCGCRDDASATCIASVTTEMVLRETRSLLRLLAHRSSGVPPGVVTSCA